MFARSKESSFPRNYTQPYSFTANKRAFDFFQSLFQAHLHVHNGTQNNLPSTGHAMIVSVTANTYAAQSHDVRGECYQNILSDPESLIKDL